MGEQLKALLGFLGKRPAKRALRALMVTHPMRRANSRCRPGLEVRLGVA
jgi:hypothetical protein